MEKCVSKELEGNNVIEIIKKVYQALLLAKKRLSAVVCNSEDQRGEDKLKRTFDEIDELCKKHQWLGELGRGYVIATFQSR